MATTLITDFLAKQITKAIDRCVDFFNETGLDRKAIKVTVEKSRNAKFGDYSCNCALTAGLEHSKAMEFATVVVKHLSPKYFKKAEVVNPGFINLFVKDEMLTDIIVEINKAKEEYGKLKRTGKCYNIEFISANPTGLLHIGHARNAAIGDTLARIWQEVGIDVTREYYINDAGNQIEKLALSVLIRYINLYGRNIPLPEDSYHGAEIIDVAKALKTQFSDKFLYLKYDNDKILRTTPREEELANEIKNYSKTYLLSIIKKTLAEFGVRIDIWYPETDLYRNHLIEAILTNLKSHTYESEGALWLKTTEKGDDKDRVLVKSDKTFTYFLPDIAYHNVKLARGYDKIFNIWGADHKSYADRMKIAVQLCGFDKDKLTILIMQMVRLMKNGQEFKMSKRSGTSLTMQDLIDAIGKDAARWFLVSQPMDSHLEIDVDKALSKNNNNPLYYVQYAHARINQVLNKVTLEKKVKSYDELTHPLERELMVFLSIYPNTLLNISHSYNPNIITLYLTNLAKLFHAYYEQVKLIDEGSPKLTQQRMKLIEAIKTVIGNGLRLMNITPVDKM